MVYISYILLYLRRALCVVILCAMAWQQWNTFLRYQERFASPIQYTKQNYDNDSGTRYGTRFTEVKKMFTSPTRMNYVAEVGETYVLSEGHFALTQYYLAPNLILRNNVPCDTIICNLYNTLHLDPSLDVHLQNGWHIVKDFNNGIIILAK